jgi:hypothetical protein
MSSAAQQIILIIFAIIAAVLATAPLELQRHIINALAGREKFERLIWLCGGYLIAALGIDGLKYIVDGGLGEAMIRSLPNSGSTSALSAATGRAMVRSPRPISNRWRWEGRPIVCPHRDPADRRIAVVFRTERAAAIRAEVKPNVMAAVGAVPARPRRSPKTSRNRMCRLVPSLTSIAAEVLKCTCGDMPGEDDH